MDDQKTEIKEWIFSGLILMAIGFLVPLAIGLMILAPLIAIPIYIVVGYIVWSFAQKYNKKREEEERIREEEERIRQEEERIRQEEERKRQEEEEERAAAAKMEEGRLIIEEVSEEFIEKAADRMERIMFKHSLSCRKCGKHALPELDTKRNYTCYNCQNKFPSTIHNLTGRKVFAHPKKEIISVVHQRGAYVPYDCSKLEEADNEAWSRGWKKIETSIAEQK